MNEDNTYTFDGQDYDFTVRLFNGINDVYLTNTVWDDLYLEEDIFDWKIKGSIVVNSPYDSLERESQKAMEVTGSDKDKLIYKFRNDGRDTLFISIKPKQPDMNSLPFTPTELTDKKWRIEIEAVIYDVDDLPHSTITDKKKKLYFWEKTFQFMTERDSDFSTANAGENKGKDNLDQLDNNARALKSCDAVAELLKSDPNFEKHTRLVGTEEWSKGSDKSKINYTSPVGSKFINDLEYLLQYTVSSDDSGFQPCLFKFERAEKSMQPKQFSLKPIKKYFENAGRSQNAPKEYQTEHFFINEISDEDRTPPVIKAPLSDNSSTEIKADEYNLIRNYHLVDMSGSDYSRNLTNYRVVSFNSNCGQFNEETEKHKAEEYKSFFKETIKDNILTLESNDRMVLTPYIRDGLNTRTIYSIQTDATTRLADGRNRLLRYYLFSNLAISFSTRGSTIRQPGRFFGLSKQNTNDKEFDHKLEGQYFVTSVIHHFSTTTRSYHTQLIGVKTHTYKELTKFEPDDVVIIK